MDVYLKNFALMGMQCIRQQKHYVTQGISQLWIINFLRHFTVVAAHNFGPGCSSILFEPGTHEQVFTIGATSVKSHKIAEFSGRGPVPNLKKHKPDCVAPGVDIMSSVPNGGYASMSGTSMSTPAVAGAVALLWSAVPELKNDIERTENLIKITAYHQNTTECYSNGNPVSGHLLILTMC